jgi:hypothetical protein
MDQFCSGNTECCSGYCLENSCTAASATGVLCGNGSDVHVCECADGIDNDLDGRIDLIGGLSDPECLGPGDDNELDFATGIPGDNLGSHAEVECPFDGNSGIGNDDDCIDFVPNGCDCVGCCLFDLNANASPEPVYAAGSFCRSAAPVTTVGAEGGPCDSAGQCGSVAISGFDVQLSCVTDGDGTGSFCSTCAPCEQIPDEDCNNSCECCEICTYAQEPACDPLHPDNECDGVVCRGHDTCLGNADCDQTIGEFCGAAGVCMRQACTQPTECIGDSTCVNLCCLPTF